MLVPVVVVGLLFLYAKIDEMTRYDPVFFTEEYLERYRSPGPVAIALEPILREGDVDAIRELFGTRRGLVIVFTGGVFASRRTRTVRQRMYE